MKKRLIEPKLYRLIEQNLAANSLAQHAINTNQPRILIVEAAKSCVGIVKEKTGRNDGELVQLIQRTVDQKASNEAWCMAFVQSMIAYVEQKLKVTSPLLATEHCMTLLNWVRKNRPDLLVERQPAVGAIPIWNYEGTSNGHTGFYLYNSAGNKFFISVEGNTSGFTKESNAIPNSTVNREGNGAFFNVRSFNGAGQMKLLNFIKPF